MSVDHEHQDGSRMRWDLDTKNPSHLKSETVMVKTREQPMDYNTIRRKIPCSGKGIPH
jgi:hypothetical protein